MATIRKIAPIFPVADVPAALDHYRRLGFHVREWEGGGYGFVRRDGFEFHVGAVPDHDPAASKSSLYIWVDDADALADEWEAAGVHVHRPEGTDWGQHEGAHRDPDGNVIRFGSPI